MSKAKTRKKAESPRASDVSNAQAQLGQLYTAHQVHTLAQLLLQRLAAGGYPNRQVMPFVGTPAAMPLVGSACNPAWAPPGPTAHGMGFVQGPPPALVYWYP